MNKTWYIKIYMKSGKVLYGNLTGNLKTTDEVAEKMFAGEKDKFNGLCSLMGGFNLFFNIGEVEAFDISDEPFK